MLYNELTNVEGGTYYVVQIMAHGGADGDAEASFKSSYPDLAQVCRRVSL